jgi:putative PIG3 family NAD(P)H quinone oxidoreductase
MRAIVVYQKDGPHLVWEAVENPAPGSGEVLIDVAAAGVNRADLLQAHGRYPPPAGVSDILGLEIAGKIAGVGAGVTGWKVGDRVCALLPGGGYAERCTVHHSLMLPLPDHWSFENGAAIPEAWLTAFSNLCMEGKLKASESVLVHAGASGVGTAAIQLAKTIGAWIAVSAGTDKKCEFCQTLGADLVFNYKKTQMSAALGDRSIDLVMDCVGAPYFRDHLNHLASGGRLIVIGIMGGRSADIDLATVLMKSLRIQGTRLRARSLEERAAIVRGFRDRFWPLLTSGRIHPVIDAVFPAQDADAAHRYVSGNNNIGKVILTMGLD